MKVIKEILIKILKQFDKLALIGILVFFIFTTMDYIESNKSNSKKLKNLSLKTTYHKYNQINNQTYNYNDLFKSFASWDKSLKRNKNKKSETYITDYSDFMQPFKIARSIADGADNKLIPYQNYLLGICPITNEPLPVPNTEQLSLYTSNYDYDKDGIPDAIEKKYGLNPEYSLDVWYDSDNDSIPNIIEYKYNKEGVLNPNIHPPLIQRIILDRIASTSIPIIVKELIKHGLNKKNWMIQLNIHNSQKGWKTKFLKIGDKFKVNNIEYTVKDIDEYYEPILNPKLGVVEEVDKSTVILEDILGQEIEAILERPVYEPNRRIILKDLYTGKEFITKVNNELDLGDNKTGKEKYKLISVGNNDRVLTFENEKDGTTYTVSTRSSYRKPASKR